MAKAYVILHIATRGLEDVVPVPYVCRVTITSAPPAQLTSYSGEIQYAALMEVEEETYEIAKRQLLSVISLNPTRHWLKQYLPDDFF